VVAGRDAESQVSREREGRQGLRKSRRDEFRIPLRAVLRGQGYRAVSRREVYGIRIYEEYPGNTRATSSMRTRLFACPLVIRQRRATLATTVMMAPS